MNAEKVKRKLVAILSADVKGYSRLMSVDEEATVRTLNTYKQAMGGLIRQYGGRVVDAPGDNLLADFASVVDAVKCAVEIQEEIKDKNKELPEDRRMEFRIGINLGDVLEEGEKIFGDGVNIVARVERLADPGGVCISGTAYDQVKNRLPFGFKSLGEHVVKNISEPVRVYRVLMEPGITSRWALVKKISLRRWRRTALSLGVVLILVVAAVIAYFYLRPSAPRVEVASKGKMAFPLPEKPSIAVLPFANMSGDPNQEFFSDGITEAIITTLSKIPDLFVIARNSTFTYKAKPVKVKQVSEELGVRYVLEGSIQKSADRVRVTAQLVDALTGHHLWAQRYDRNMKELFALQDEMTLEIVLALRVKLTEGEQELVRHRSTNNLEAWGHAVRAYSLFERFTKEDNAKARELFERAVELDPNYAWAWTFLAWTHWIDTRYFTQSREESFKRAVELAQKSVKLSEKNPDVHALLGGIHLFQRQYAEAVAAGERSVALGPNNAENLVLLGHTFLFVGRFEEAIELIRKAMRLHPYYPPWYLVTLGSSLYLSGRYEEANAAYQEVIRRTRDVRGPIPMFAQLLSAACFGMLNRDREARDHLGEGRNLWPKTEGDFSLENVRNWWAKRTFYQNPAHVEQLMEGMRRAGLK